MGFEAPPVTPKARRRGPAPPPRPPPPPPMRYLSLTQLIQVSRVSLAIIWQPLTNRWSYLLTISKNVCSGDISTSVVTKVTGAIMVGDSLRAIPKSCLRMWHSNFSAVPIWQFPKQVVTSPHGVITPRNSTGNITFGPPWDILIHISIVSIFIYFNMSCFIFLILCCCSHYHIPLCTQFDLS